MGPNSTQYNAALYMRLSKDDDNGEESSSITTQRKMLLSFAKENSFKIFDEYIDDGWSGTNFDRPNFKRMIEDIEKKNVNLVITKDLSRLGRDYITAGQYTEIYFPSKRVRYIAINDGYDSDSPYTDIAPFKNVINEMYARDTSKKIRSSFTTKMKEGSFIGNFAPYGYIKDPQNKNHLLIDNEVAPIVRKIFDMAIKGNNPIDIARYLNKMHIPTPAVYRCEKYSYLNIDNYSKRKEWTSANISKILHNVVYLGDMAQRKTTKVSFKSNLTVQNPKKDWIVVKNTHEPIICQEDFDTAKKRILSRSCSKKGNFKNIFSGIAKCQDCGKNMSTVGSRKKGSLANLACGGYKLYGNKECSNHFIDYNVLHRLVLDAIREQVELSDAEKNDMFTELKSKIKSQDNTNDAKKNLKKLNDRIDEIDSIIEHLYEDNLCGVINESRFKKLLEKYEAENEILNQKIETIKSALSKKNDNMEHAIQSFENFSKLIGQYTEIEELTEDLLFKLIDRIEIGQGHYEKTPKGKVKYQTVKIYFKFVGEYTVRKREL